MAGVHERREVGINDFPPHLGRHSQKAVIAHNRRIVNEDIGPTALFFDAGEHALDVV